MDLNLNSYIYIGGDILDHTLNDGDIINYIVMSSSLITKAKNFDGSIHTYDEPIVDSRGGKSVRTKYKTQPLNIQIPWMLTWGVNKWEDENTGRCKYDASLQFDPHKSDSQVTFLDEMKVFEEKVKQDAVKNSKKWYLFIDYKR